MTTKPAKDEGEKAIRRAAREATEREQPPTKAESSVPADGYIHMGADRLRDLLIERDRELATVRAERDAAIANNTEPEQLAKAFHEAYERLAPAFGYKTREESAKPWKEVPENNRKLMIAVCAEILAAPANNTELEGKLAELANFWESEGKRCYEIARKRSKDKPVASVMAQSVRFWECAKELRAALAGQGHGKV